MTSLKQTATVALLLLAMLAVGCGGSDNSPSPRTTPSSQPPQAAPTAATQAPLSTPQTAAATSAELQQVAARFYPKFTVALDPAQPTRVNEFFGMTCYGYSGTAKLDPAGPCPVSARLTARLRQIEANITADKAEIGMTNVLCRCQNTAATRNITVEATPSGGIAHVVVNFGTTPLRVDLVLIRENGSLVVDDQFCTGKPETSLYAGRLGGGACS